MKLMEWLKRPGQERTQDEFGRQVGLSQGRISQIAQNGTSDLRTALDIEAATGGLVTLAELMMERRSSTEPAPTETPPTHANGEAA